MTDLPATTFRVEVTVRNNNTKEIITKQDVITYDQPRMGTSKGGEVALVFKPVPNEEIRFAHEKARFEKAQAEYRSWLNGARTVEDDFGLPAVGDVV